MSRNLLHWNLLLTVEFDKLEVKLLVLINRVLHFVDIEAEHRSTIENALSLWQVFYINLKF